MKEIVTVFTGRTNPSIMIEKELKRKTTITTKEEELVVCIEAIIIQSEGYVNLMIWVYSGYPDTC